MLLKNNSMETSVKLETKDSVVGWFGYIPDTWKVIKIKYLCYVKGRIGFHGLNSAEFSDNTNLPYLVTGTDFIDQKVNWETCYHISQERYEEDTYIQLVENDLLITKDGTIGKTAIVKNKPKYATLNSGIMVVRPNSRLLSEFLKYILNSTHFTYFIDLQYQGSTIKHLYQDTFNNFQILLPPPEAQKNIIDYLDTKTEQIKNFIDDKKKLISLLEEQKRSVIYNTLTKGLETKIKMKPSGVGWIGDVPENYKIVKLKNILSKLTDGSHVSVEAIDDGYPYVTVANIDQKSGKIDLESCQKISKKEYEQLVRNGCKPELNDILFSQIGTIGLTVEVKENADFVMLSSLAILRPFADKIKNNYLIYCLLSDFVVQQYTSAMEGGAVKRITLSQISNFRIPLPTIDVQEKIVENLDKKILKINQAISTVQQEIELIEEYKKSLIYQAVTGKIETLLTNK